MQSTIFKIALLSSLLMVIFSCSGRETREEYYPDGSTKARWTEIKRKDGKFYKDGKYEEWYEGGQKKLEKNFKNGHNVGEFTQWTEEGYVEWSGEIKDSISYLTRTGWYESGQKASEVEAKATDEHGIREHGKYTEWYENGQMKSEVKYNEGEKHGPFTEWYENGQSKYKGEYKEGKRVGKLLGWDENGNIIREEIYQDGKLIEKIK